MALDFLELKLSASYLDRSLTEKKKQLWDIDRGFNGH